MLVFMFVHDMNATKLLKMTTPHQLLECCHFKEQSSYLKGLYTHQGDYIPSTYEMTLGSFFL